VVTQRVTICGQTPRAHRTSIAGSGGFDACRGRGRFTAGPGCPSCSRRGVEPAAPRRSGYRHQSSWEQACDLFVPRISNGPYSGTQEQAQSCPPLEQKWSDRLLKAQGFGASGMQPGGPGTEPGRGGKWRASIREGRIKPRAERGPWLMNPSAHEPRTSTARVTLTAAGGAPNGNPVEAEPRHGLARRTRT